MVDADSPADRESAQLDELRSIYRRGAELGFLGRSEPDFAVDRSECFVRQLVGEGRILDLGSGGGMPGLTVAARCPEARVVMVDISRRRTAFLRHAVRRMDLAERVEVVCADATALGHDRRHRERYDAVVARAFRAPAFTAECGSAFLRLGGRLIVSVPPARPSGDSGASRSSEPPPGPEGWPLTDLARLGLARAEHIAESAADAPFRLLSMRKVTSLDAGLPRPARTLRRDSAW